MRKLIYILALAPLFLLSSCFDDDSGPSPATPGIIMHNYIVAQNFIALEPIAQAFKLNVLLNEAQERGISIYDESLLNDMDITFGTANTKMTMLELLFPYSSGIKIVDEDVYDVILNKSGNGITYNGKVRIYTNGELLDDLSAENSWVIELLPHTKNSYTYTEGVETLTISGDVEYAILSAGQPYKWEIAVNGFKAYSNIVESSQRDGWSGDYLFARTKGTDRLTVEGSHASTFTMQGGAGGTILYGLGMEYTIPASDPLTYVSCENVYRNYLLQSGTMNIKFTQDMDKGEFPVSESKSVWTKSSQSCNYKLTIYYNGYTYPVGA